jgi:hypothetical protein
MMTMMLSEQIKQRQISVPLIFQNANMSAPFLNPTSANQIKPHFRINFPSQDYRQKLARRYLYLECVYIYIKYHPYPPMRVTVAQARTPLA